MLKSAVCSAAVILALVTILPAQSREKKEREPDVRIRSQRFSPADLKVKAGQSVVWLNEDDRDHSIIASDKTFKSGNLRNGDRFEHKFTDTGKHSYQCAYHPREKGAIIVEEAKR